MVKQKQTQTAIPMPPVILNLFQDLSADKGQEKALGEMLN